MRSLLADFRVRRLLLANLTSSIGSGVTIVAVPWMLVQREGGEKLFGYITIFTTLVMFLIIPYYGAWLDRHSRKMILLAGEAFGAVSAAVMGVWALFQADVSAAQLLITYFCGMLYYSLHFPAKFAFMQQIFARQHYQQLTGLVEIQGQVASMAAGGLAAVLIANVSLGTILLINTATYLTSFVLQATLPYVADHQKPGAVPTSAWRAMGEGWRWLSARPRLSWFFLCTYVPFIAVMVSNYLFPIYVSNVLEASATVYGQGEMAFAAGALLAGLLVPLLAHRHGPTRVVMGTMALFLVGLAVLALVPGVWTYFPALLILGLGNAGSRVARSALVLTLVPNAVIGRVQLFFSAWDRCLRTVLIFVATLLSARSDAAAGFVMLLVVASVAFIGMLVCRRAVRTSLGEAATG